MCVCIGAALALAICNTITIDALYKVEDAKKWNSANNDEQMKCPSEINCNGSRIYIRIYPKQRGNHRCVYHINIHTFCNLRNRLPLYYYHYTYKVQHNRVHRHRHRQKNEHFLKWVSTIFAKFVRHFVIGGFKDSKKLPRMTFETLSVSLDEFDREIFFSFFRRTLQQNYTAKVVEPQRQPHASLS